MTLFTGKKVKYNGNFYRPIGSLNDDKVRIGPLRVCKENEVFWVEKSDLEMIFMTRIWVAIRNCNAIYNGFENDLVILGVRPSIDVEILEAKEVERGVFESKLPKSEITRMWEERYQLGDFPFPDNLEKIKELDLKEILK
jgi:hypothetical protein